MYVHMCRHMSKCEYNMCLCMYMQVYTYVYACELTIGMHIGMRVYEYVHIGARIYLCGYVKYVCSHMYFVQEPPIQPFEYKWS